MPTPSRIIPFGLAGLLGALVVLSVVAALLPSPNRAAAPAGQGRNPTATSTRPHGANAEAPVAAPYHAVTLVPTPSPTDVSPARAALLEAIRDLEGVQVGVGAINLASKEKLVAGDHLAAISASIVKLDIVMTLLLQRQDRAEPLSAAEREDVRLAMHWSDNGAADRLLAGVGDAAGVMRANETFGLKATTMAPGDWISTKTTMEDQLQLLGAVVADDSPLNARSRAYLADTMSGVDGGQDWGVGRTSPRATVKNGWMHHPDDWDGWILNSVGTTRTATGDLVLMVVFTQGWGDVALGIDGMDELARATLSAVS